MSTAAARNAQPVTHQDGLAAFSLWLPKRVAEVGTVTVSADAALTCMALMITFLCLRGACVLAAERKSRRGPRCKVTSVWRAWQKQRRAARGGAGETAVPDLGGERESFDAHGLAGETAVEDPPARASCFDFPLRHQGKTRKVTLADVRRGQHGLSHGFVYGRPGGGVGSVSAKSTRAKREEPTRKKKRRPQSKVARDPAVRRVSDEDWAELCAA